MLNKVQLIGVCGQDPTSRFFPSGDQQTTISLATSKRWKDKSTGERKEKTSWHQLVFNRGLAKIAADYLKKGSKIYVEGEIDYQEWVGQDGTKKYATRIIVDEMHMLDSRSGGTASYGDSNTPPAGSYGNRQPAPAAPQSAPANYDDMDLDIPFASLNWQIKAHLI